MGQRNPVFLWKKTDVYFGNSNYRFSIVNEKYGQS